MNETATKFLESKPCTMLRYMSPPEQQVRRIRWEAHVSEFSACMMAGLAFGEGW